MNEPTTSPTLIHQAVAGQPAAWARMVQIYGPLLYQWSRRRGLSPSDAADVVQDSLFCVSQDLVHFDRGQSGGRFRGWLWTILIRRIADAARRRPAEGLLGSGVASLVDPRDPNAPDAPPGDEGSDAAGVLQRAVASYRDRYDPKTWRAFWATVVDGRRADDVAAELGVTRWAVYKARSRILHRLRCDLDGLV